MTTTSTEPNTPLSATPSKWVLVCLIVTIMVTAMDATIVSTAIPNIVGSLGGFSLFTWVFSIYVLAETITIPIYGKLADQYGRKPILICGLVIFLIGSLACAFSWNMTSLIAFRGFQGLGAGAVMATVNTLAGDLYSVEERAKIQGWLSSAWGLSSLIGPTLGGALAEYTSWHWIFLINLPIGGLSIYLIRKFVHEKVFVKKHQVDYWGATFILLTIGTLVYGILQSGEAWPWWSKETLIISSLVLFFGFITFFIEKKAPEPILPKWLFNQKVLLGGNVSMVLMGAAMMGPTTYFPTYAQSVYGLGAILAGLLLGVMSVGWPLASGLSGKVYLKLGFRNTGIIGVFILILTSSGFLFLSVDSSLYFLIPIQFFLGAGFGMLSTPVLVGAQSIVHWDKRGVVTGMNMFSRYLGASVGAVIYGAIFNNQLRKYLATAPADLKIFLPEDFNQVIHALQNPNLPKDVHDFLKEGVFHSTWSVYLTIGIIAVLILFSLRIMPKRFPIIQGINTPDSF